MGNQNRATDVRIVPHHGMWAVKLTGGYGNKPVKITERLDEARRVGARTAYKYEIPLIEFDANGLQVKTTPWKQVGPF